MVFNCNLLNKKSSCRKSSSELVGGAFFFDFSSILNVMEQVCVLTM
jgi:hypothetical protein